MGRASKKLDPRKGSSKRATQKKKQSERDGLLQEHLRCHMKEIGCFHCKTHTGALQFAHFIQRKKKGIAPKEDPPIWPMVVYVGPKSRNEKSKKVLAELNKTGILCKTCHHEHDKELRGGKPVTWKDKFKQKGAAWSCWSEYVSTYLLESENIDGETD